MTQIFYKTISSRSTPGNVNHNNQHVSNFNKSNCQSNGAIFRMPRKSIKTQPTATASQPKRPSLYNINVRNIKNGTRTRLRLDSKTNSYLERYQQQFGSFSAPTVMDNESQCKNEPESEIGSFCNGRLTLYSNWPQTERKLKCRERVCKACYCGRGAEVVYRKPMNQTQVENSFVPMISTKRKSGAYCTRLEVSEEERASKILENSEHDSIFDTPLNRTVDSSSQPSEYKQTQTDLKVEKLENWTQVEWCTCPTCHTLTKESNLSNIQQFRDSNYFETHSTGYDKHRCVYSFALNDGLEPVLVNPDECGRFKCLLCGKPLLEEMKVKPDAERRVSFDPNVKSCLKKAKLEEKPQMKLLSPRLESYALRRQKGVL